MAPLTKIVALFEKIVGALFLALFSEKVAHLDSKQLEALFFDLSKITSLKLLNSNL